MLRKKIKMILLSIGILFLCFHMVLGDKVFTKESVGKVLAVDNDDVIIQGISKIGSQHLEVIVKTGLYKGEKIYVENFLSGSIEYDEYYEVEDEILFATRERGEDGKLYGKAISYFRMNKVLLLFSIFVLAIVLYAGKIGVKALLTFVGSIAIIIYYFVPALKRGDNIFLITILTLIFLSAFIIFTVTGFCKKGWSAFLGTLSGLFVTAVLTFLFGDGFRLDGMSQPMAQAVFFSNATGINLLDIYYSAMIVGASGAAMDIAMDMTATIEELKFRNPNISRKDLIISGFNVGKFVIGTMTTTLLLAYSGGFLTLMILFLERETSLLQILNLKSITSEIIKIIIGSIGLITVAPMTTYIAAYIYSKTE